MEILKRLAVLPFYRYILSRAPLLLRRAFEASKLVGFACLSDLLILFQLEQRERKRKSK